MLGGRLSGAVRSIESAFAGGRGGAGQGEWGIGVDWSGLN